jgi:hypothetical protein
LPSQIARAKFTLRSREKIQRSSVVERSAVNLFQTLFSVFASRATLRS